jgi:hypothetical protein
MTYLKFFLGSVFATGTFAAMGHAATVDMEFKKHKAELATVEFRIPGAPRALLGSGGRAPIQGILPPRREFSLDLNFDGIVELKGETYRMTLEAWTKLAGSSSANAQVEKLKTEGSGEASITIDGEEFVDVALHVVRLREPLKVFNKIKTEYESALLDENSGKIRILRHQDFRFVTEVAVIDAWQQTETNTSSVSVAGKLDSAADPNFTAGVEAALTKSSGETQALTISPNTIIGYNFSRICWVSGKMDVYQIDRLGADKGDCSNFSDSLD